MKKLFTLLFSLSLVIFANAADKYAQGAIDWAVGPWYDAATGGAATTAPAAGDNVFTQGNIITIAADAVCDNLTFTSLAGQFVISPEITLTVRGKVDCTAAGTLDAFSTMDATAKLKLTGEALTTDYTLVTNAGATGMRPKNLVIQAVNTTNTYIIGSSNVNYVHGTGLFTVKAGTKLTIKCIMQLGIAATNGLIVEEGATVLTELNMKGDGGNSSKMNSATINGSITCKGMLNALTLTIGDNGYINTFKADRTDTYVNIDGFWGATNAPTLLTNFGYPATLTVGTNWTMEFGKSGNQNIPGVLPNVDPLVITPITYANMKVSGSGTKTIRHNITATGNLVVNTGCTIATVDGVSASFGGILVNFGTVTGVSNSSYAITGSVNDVLMGKVDGSVSGSSVTLVATPLAGYQFVNWKEGETVLSTNATYTFPAASVTVMANFQAATAVKNTTVINVFAVVNGNNIQLNGDINSIEIYNAQGKLIKSQSKVTTISVDSKGIYLVKMNTATGYKVQKVIVN